MPVTPLETCCALCVCLWAAMALCASRCSSRTRYDTPLPNRSPCPHLPALCHTLQHVKTYECVPCVTTATRAHPNDPVSYRRVLEPNSPATTASTTTATTAGAGGGAGAGAGAGAGSGGPGDDDYAPPLMSHAQGTGPAPSTPRNVQADYTHMARYGAGGCWMHVAQGWCAY